ncbi:MAG: TRAP transporter small permease [Fusobacteriaceae bacterium]
MNFIKVIFDKMEKLMEYMGMVLLSSMILIIGGQVVSRYFFKFTPRWSEELALLCMIWFSFIGMAIGVKMGIHISIEYFMDRAPKSVKKYVGMFDQLLVITFGVILLIKGYELSEMTWYSVMPSLGIPTTFQYAAVPISGFFIAVYALFDLIAIIKNKGERG